MQSHNFFIARKLTPRPQLLSLGVGRDCMNTLHTELLIGGCLLAAAFTGIRLRRLLPEHHLSDDSKDAIKLAMGLVATLTALVLGLLVSSAKNGYDTK